MCVCFMLAGLCFCVLCVECGVAVGQEARARYERLLIRQARDQVSQVLEQMRTTCEKKCEGL